LSHLDAPSPKLGCGGQRVKLDDLCLLVLLLVLRALVQVTELRVGFGTGPRPALIVTVTR
jgi:hypothetical protein